MKVLNFSFSRLFDVYYEKFLQKTGFQVRFLPIIEVPSRLPQEVLSWEEDGIFHVSVDPEAPTELTEIETAHELTHGILTAEGYPITRIPNHLSWDGDLQGLKSRLGSAILNPLVDERLKQHGFDLEPYYDRYIRTLVCRLASQDPRSIRRFPTMRINAIIYLGNCFNEDISKERQALADFLQCAPSPQWELARKAERIVQEEGNKTPDQCLRATIRVRDLLEADLIYVVDPRTGSYY